MFRSYRSALIAIGLIVIFAQAPLGQTQQQPEETLRNTKQEQTPAQSLPLPFPVEIIENPAKADTRQSQEAEARQRDIEELIAQKGINAATQAMNEATQRMAQYSIWSTIFVGIGTVLVFVSLMLMRSANAAAVAAAKAADKTVEVTQDIGQRQIRAYVIAWNIRVKNFKKGQVADIIFDIDNRGQTPATIIKLAVGGRPDKNPHNVPIKEIDRGLIVSSCVIGGQTKMKQPHKLNIPEKSTVADDFFDGSLSYAIGGYIIYRDIFNKTRRTVFRCYFSSKWLKDGESVTQFCSRNNRMS